MCVVLGGGEQVGVSFILNSARLRVPDWFIRKKVRPAFDLFGILLNTARKWKKNQIFAPTVFSSTLDFFMHEHISCVQLFMPPMQLILIDIGSSSRNRFQLLPQFRFFAHVTLRA